MEAWQQWIDESQFGTGAPQRQRRDQVIERGQWKVTRVEVIVLDQPEHQGKSQQTTGVRAADGSDEQRRRPCPPQRPAGANGREPDVAACDGRRQPRVSVDLPPQTHATTGEQRGCGGRATSGRDRQRTDREAARAQRSD